MIQNLLHPAWIEISLAQFRKNIELIRKFIYPSLYCLPIKANAYGHGLCEIGREAENGGIDYLGVAHLQEGVQLRKSGVKIPILVFGAIHENQIDALIDWNLEFSISSKFKADFVKKKGVAKPCRVHLEVDTGMQRTGVRPETAKTLFEYLRKSKCFEVVGIYSHFATANEPNDSFTIKQIDRFRELISDPVFEGVSLIRHLCNSGGAIFCPNAHFDMVRPGIATFGYLPKDPPKELDGIASCFSLKAKVSYFKVIEQGEGISYGHSYVTSRRTRIVTVSIGYGDGFRRSLSNRGIVLIRGRRFPIVGTICMDQLMVDVGDSQVHVGDEVVLIGRQGEETISLEEVATLCDTIPYELLCFFNERVPRIYVD